MSRGSAAIIAGVAGYASFHHLWSVALRAGERHDVAWTIPLGIDGLIAVGVTALVADRRDGREPRLFARAAIYFGVLATVAGNLASAGPELTSRLVAIVPPIAFLLAVAVLEKPGKIKNIGNQGTRETHRRFVTDEATSLPTLPSESGSILRGGQGRPISLVKTRPAAPRKRAVKAAPVTERPTAGMLRSNAREAYRASVESGTPIAGRALGEQFGMSTSWGEARVTEVKRERERINGGVKTS